MRAKFRGFTVQELKKSFAEAYLPPEVKLYNLPVLNSFLSRTAAQLSWIQKHKKASPLLLHDVFSVILTGEMSDARRPEKFSVIEPGAVDFLRWVCSNDWKSIIAKGEGYGMYERLSEEQKRACVEFVRLKIENLLDQLDDQFPERLRLSDALREKIERLTEQLKIHRENGQDVVLNCPRYF